MLIKLEGELGGGTVDKVSVSFSNKNLYQSRLKSTSSYILNLLALVLLLGWDTFGFGIEKFLYKNLTGNL